MNVIPLHVYRDGGLADDYVSDETLLSAEEDAWKFVETFCNQFFERRSLTLYMDGSGYKELILPYPIISISSVTEETYDSKYSRGISSWIPEHHSSRRLWIG